MEKARHSLKCERVTGVSESVYLDLGFACFNFMIAITRDDTNV